MAFEWEISEEVSSVVAPIPLGPTPPKRQLFIRIVDDGIML